jgi:hypothetical protein
MVLADGVLLMVASTVAWLYNPAWFEWAHCQLSQAARWMGVAGFVCGVAWLFWMFHTSGEILQTQS